MLVEELSTEVCINSLRSINNLSLTKSGRGVCGDVFVSDCECMCVCLYMYIGVCIIYIYSTEAVQIKCTARTVPAL